MNKEYLFILKVILVITFPVSFILILFPEQLVLLMWGKDWIQVASLLPYFGLLVISQGLLSSTGNILVLLGKERKMRLSGWLGAAATITGIVYGATESITAIAQYYSLAFIVIVLPFNMFYLFISAFNFDKRSMLIFWLPLISISVLIWMACFYQSSEYKLLGILAFFLYIMIITRKDLVPLIRNLSKKLNYNKGVLQGQ